MRYLWYIKFLNVIGFLEQYCKVMDAINKAQQVKRMKGFLPWNEWNSQIWQKQNFTLDTRPLSESSENKALLINLRS